MSIAPVNSFPPPERNESAPKPRTVPVQAPVSAASRAAEKAPPPVSVSRPKQKIAVADSAPVRYEPQQDVVELHQDPDIKGQLIVQYLDKAKNVILQVPSSQELAVERGIAQDIQQEAKLHEAGTKLP